MKSLRTIWKGPTACIHSHHETLPLISQSQKLSSFSHIRHEGSISSRSSISTSGRFGGESLLRSQRLALLGVCRGSRRSDGRHRGLLAAKVRKDAAAESKMLSRCGRHGRHQSVDHRIRAASSRAAHENFARVEGVY